MMTVPLTNCLDDQLHQISKLITAAVPMRRRSRSSSRSEAAKLSVSWKSPSAAYDDEAALSQMLDRVTLDDFARCDTPSTMAGARLSAYCSSITPSNNSDSDDWDFSPSSFSVFPGLAGAKWSASSACQESNHSMHNLMILKEIYVVTFT